MPTSPVTSIVSGASFTVSVTPANLDIDNTILDYLVLEAGTLTLNPGNYTKTTAGTVIQYSGVALAAATTLEIRRRTPRLQRNIQAVGTKIRSSDWNAEFDRTVRINEEYDVYGAGGGFSVRLPLDAAFGVAWDGDVLFPPTRNAVYDQVVLKSNINSPAFTGVPTAPTATTADSSTTLATTAHVKANLTPYALLASPALTGIPTVPTAATSDSGTTIANTVHVKNNLANYLTLSAAVTTYANLSSPTFVGVPLAPTAALSVNTTQLATTQFVRRAQRPMCILSRVTSVQAITAAAITTLVFNNAIRDVDAAYNTTTGVFTAPRAGYYQFTSFVRGSATSGAFILLMTTVALADLGRLQEIATTGTSTPVNGVIVLYLAAAATCTFGVFAGVASNISFETNTTLRSNTHASIHYLGDDV